MVLVVRLKFLVLLCWYYDIIGLKIWLVGLYVYVWYVIVIVLIVFVISIEKWY